MYHSKNVCVTTICEFCSQRFFIINLRNNHSKTVDILTRLFVYVYSHGVNPTFVYVHDSQRRMDTITALIYTCEHSPCAGGSRPCGRVGASRRLSRKPTTT